MSRSSYPLTIDNKNQLKPKLPLKLTNPENGKCISVLALVDSGAEKCTFPMMIAINLGIPLNKSTESKTRTAGISGQGLETYSFKIKIDILNMQRNSIVKTMNLEVSFIKNNSIPPLVGTADFLENFNLMINYPQKSLTLEW
ncbi:hypothetical protein SAMN04487907_101254 [Zunongwangia mangrovi]|uniref:Aspartyl protease n=1 Tax=Zunongwangia mangrovi TaxID=1334022 RepID=A0A1I1DAY2_9FLAO|nr:hypothetical protein [Zunongwangia mangrovi]SFB72095.1 hypothetical protein SAMN04487907_101254 [Zunongwangia mangrovi]